MHTLPGDELPDELAGAVADPLLATTLGRLRLRNPIILASGFLGETGQSLVRCFAHGCGGVVTKSIGTLPRLGHANPTVVEVDGGLLNAIGLANPGMEHYRSELAAVRDAQVPGPIIGSIFGADPQEFSQLAKGMAAAGADALELNLSCPHVKGVGTEVGSDPRLVEQITAATTAAVSIPVFVKLSPNIADILPIAAAAVDGGAAGLTAINTVRGMAIDVRLRRPILSHGQGGLSGPAIRPVGVAAVFRIASHLQVPIMGVGGISCGADALEYLMAGAHAVQVGTALMDRGPLAFAHIATELRDFLRVEGFGKVSEVIGLAQGERP